MRRIMPTSVFVLVVLLLVASVGSTLADSAQFHDGVRTSHTPSATLCTQLSDPEQKIKTIVEFARTPAQDSKDIRACYDTLTEIQKAQVFYQTAKKLGLDKQLDEEKQNNPSGGIQPLAYGTLHTTWTAIGRGDRRTAYTYWTDDGSRCRTGHGSETNFAYSFSTNVTDPAALRANSPWNVLVDSAILYYTVNYGGLKTWYDTNSTIITTCVGDTTLSTVGGANVWQANAVVYKMVP